MLVAAAGAGAAPDATSAKRLYPGAVNPKFKPPKLNGQSMRVIFGSSASTAKIAVLHAIDLLKSWGATTTVTYIDSQAVTTSALARGDADVTVQGALDGFGLVEANFPLKAIALSAPRLDYGLICKPSITSLSQLRGASIGVLDNTGVTYGAAVRPLKRAGLTVSDVKIIQTGGKSARVAALLSGRSDCTMLYTSDMIPLQAQGYNNIYSYIRNSPDLTGDMVWATPDWIAGHKTLIRALNEALLLSYRWINNPKNKNAFIAAGIANVPGTDANVLSTVWNVYTSSKLTPSNAILTPALVTHNQAVYRDLGLLRRITPASEVAELQQPALALKAVGPFITKKKKK